MQESSGSNNAPSLGDPSRIALFLDLDGTVLDIAHAPTEVKTPPDLIPALKRLQAQLDGAVAILTGRQIADVDRLLAPLRLPAAGVHGNEFRLEPDGEIEIESSRVPGSLVDALADFVGAIPGLLLEHKDISVAVHYRAAPEMAPKLQAEIHRLLDEHDNDLVLSHGRRVFELVPEGVTKGTALARLMQSPRFRGRLPVVIGDDMSDEAAHAVAAELGGLGLKVKGEHFSSETHFGGPDEVRRWLHELAETLDK